MNCKICESEKIVKNGKRNGAQCYLCKNCGHQFTSEFGRHKANEEEMAVSLYSAGLSFRTIGMMFYVNASTVMRWVKDYLELRYQKPLPKGEIIIERDEMYRFIQSKKTTCAFGRRITEQLDRLLGGKLEID